VVGKSLDQYNGYDDDTLLLVGTYHGKPLLAEFDPFLTSPRRRSYRNCYDRLL
jgi:hypothetical protein